MKRCCFVFAATAVVAICAMASGCESEPTVTEESVVQLGQARGQLYRYTVATATQLSVASVVREGRKLAIAIDGKPGPWLDRVDLGHFTFGPNGKRHAYVGTKGRKKYLFVDHEQVAQVKTKIREWDAHTGVVFSKNGEEYVYREFSWLPKRRRFIVGGKVLPVPQRMDSIYLSDDGQHYAYSVTPGRKDRKGGVFLDGKELPTPDEGRAVWLRFAPEGGNLVYIWEYNDGSQEIVIGGKRGLRKDGATVMARGSSLSKYGPVVFSEDGQHIAYRIIRDDPPSAQVIVDGKPDEPVREVVDASFTFHSDGTKYAYVADNGSGRFLVIDGKPVSSEYRYLSKVIFSPGQGRVFSQAQRDDKSFLLIDGKELGPYTSISSLVFSPDGKHYAFVDRDDKTTLVVDGEGHEQPTDRIPYLKYAPDGRLVYMFSEPYDREFPRAERKSTLVIDGESITADNPNFRPIFSEDGDHVAYGTGRPTSLDRYVVDGKVFPTVVDPRNPSFSPEGEHFVYGGGVSSEQMRVRQLFVDGKPAGSTYDQVGLFTSKCVFQSEDTCQVLAERDNMIYRITVNW